MNVLFLTIIDFETIEEKNIYTDLLRVFRKNGHRLYVISPEERRKKGKTRVQSNDGVTILKLKTGNLQKTNFIEKGISTCLLEPQFIRGIKKNFSDIKFDLVLYSTPPITFVKAIRYVKNRDDSYAYLLLKDIFPQNAVDLQILNTNGMKKWIYRYFRKKEKSLYAFSNKIGCMSQANVDYILKNNPSIHDTKLEVCPNSIELDKINKKNNEEIYRIRKRYGVPDHKVIFIYGGNLGAPQGVPFLMKCIEANEDESNSFLLIVGSGTEYPKLKHFFQARKLQNAKLLESLPVVEYKELAAASDVGLIFLDSRFTIPNFPSRLLAYLEQGMPVLAATDRNTDIGKIIVNGGFGEWCSSDSVEQFIECERKLLDESIRKQYGTAARKYLEENYDVENTYKIIMNAAGRKNV